MSILAQRRRTSDRYSLLNERAALSQSVRSEKREEEEERGSGGVGGERGRSKPSRGEERDERLGWSSSGGDYRLANETQSSSSGSSSSVAAIHHNAIFSPVLPLQPINTVELEFTAAGWGKVGGETRKRQTQTEDEDVEEGGYRKRERERSHQKRRVVLLCCHGDTPSRAGAS